MTADLPKIAWSEQKAELRSRLSSLEWFARLDEYDQLFMLQLWEKAAPTGVLGYACVLLDITKIRRILWHLTPTVVLDFHDKFFFTDYIAVTYGTLILSDPKHYQVFCQLMEHDLDVATMLRYVPMQR